MILFLDFDGVLHKEPSLANDAFCRLPLIEEILMNFPPVQIVVSSVWRLDWATEAEGIAGLREHFSYALRGRLVGVTPDFRQVAPQTAPDGLGLYLREWECMDWLRNNRPAGTTYLMLDDRHWWFRPNNPHLMIVDGDDGFLPANEDELRSRLKALDGQPTSSQPVPQPDSQPAKKEVRRDHAL